MGNRICWVGQLRQHPWGGVPTVSLERSPHQEEAVQYMDLLWKYGGPEAPEAQEFAASLPKGAHIHLSYMVELWLGIQDDPECARIVKKEGKLRSGRRCYRLRQSLQTGG